jgi:hypothetical protein
MSSTGPSGVDLIYMLKAAAAAAGATGLPMTTEIVPSEPLHIATMEELLASHAVVASKEVIDKETLSILLNETRETLRDPLFQWAALGFQPIYIVQSFTIVEPAVCSDGVKRSTYEYIEYCLGTDMASIIATLQTKVTGIEFSYSISGNTLNIHVSKGT